MSQYIIESGSKQYVVAQGEFINVDRLTAEAGSTIDMPVVFSFTGTTPATIPVKVVEHNKGKKLRIVKFRNKSNYHKVSGFRPYQTRLEIL
jgi:large subunit ribosomal protein L21